MSPADGALLTDLYQLTMAHAYFELEMNDTAVFELAVRRLPSERRFLVAAGLERALEHLESLRFTGSELEYLASLNTFPRRFLDYLQNLRFSGSVHAMPEGTPFFAEEPTLRVTAPLIEAQLVESRLLNILHFQTLVASKAVRCVEAARGRRLIDFGMRRAHEGDAALLAARAAYVAGFDATATVAAARRFGIALAGTMAHSFVEAHDSEADAFRHFVLTRPQSAALLVDTYDTERAVQRVIDLEHELSTYRSPGRRVHAIRIDSGDLSAQARSARVALDARGCEHIQIVLSGGLDEHAIEAILAQNTPVDAFGVGTALVVSADAPALDIAYKLHEYAGVPRRKRSPAKTTWPGAKQVYRERGAAGEALADHIALAEEPGVGEPLLAEVMRDGRRITAAESLSDIRVRCQREVRALPAAVRELWTDAAAYPVTFSPALRRLAAASPDG